MRSKIKLSDRMIRSVPYGSEEQSGSSVLVPTVLFALMLGGWLIATSPLGIPIQFWIVFALLIGGIAVKFAVWYCVQMFYLAEERSEKLKRYFEAETEDLKVWYLADLKELGIYNPEEAVKEEKNSKRK